MSKHTPGPWFAGTDEDGHMIYDSDLNGVASALRDDGDAETEGANALLIAAAPELYEACKELLEMADTSYGNETTFARLKRARAAIAKAEGKSK